MILIRSKRSLTRTLGVAKLYDLDALHPNTMAQVYHAAAQVYAIHQDADTTLSYLADYTKVCISDFFPYALHGDNYFDAIQPWFEHLTWASARPAAKKSLNKACWMGWWQTPSDFIKMDRRFQGSDKTIEAHLTNKGDHQ